MDEGSSGGAGPQLSSEKQSEAVGRVGAAAWQGQQEPPNEVLGLSGSHPSSAGIIVQGASGAQPDGRLLD